MMRPLSANWKMRRSHYERSSEPVHVRCRSVVLRGLHDGRQAGQRRKCGPARLTLWTLPARFEVVTILIAQTSDLLAPISKSTTHTWSTCTKWICARYLVGAKGLKQKQSAVKLGSRPNFRKDHAGFPNPETIRLPTVEKTEIFVIFQLRPLAEREGFEPPASPPTWLDGYPGTAADRAAGENAMWHCLRRSAHT
jgi:hypothetical protein